MQKSANTISKFLKHFIDCVFQQVKSTIVEPPCANTSREGPLTQNTKIFPVEPLINGLHSLF